MIRHAEVIKAHLEKEKLTREELTTLLRRQGVHQFHEAELAILGSDGSLIVTLNHRPS